MITQLKPGGPGAAPTSGHRSSTFFSSARSIAATTLAGTPGTKLATDGAGSNTTLNTTSGIVVPPNAAWPVSISNTTAPSANTSVRPST